MNKRLILLLSCLAWCATTAAGDVHVAVASNFRATLEQLTAPFESRTGHRLTISTGSTGKLYAQIVNGAPYDVLLAADQTRPEQLEAQGFGARDGRFTYALGRLILCGIDPDTSDPRAWLQSDSVRRIAIANPRHAPYGQAAVSVLEQWDIREAVQSKLVTGENINQAMQFLHARNVDAAFLARSQRDAVSATCTADQVGPEVVQQALILNATPAAADFRQFMQSAAAAEIMQAAGYDLPLNRPVLPNCHASDC